MLLLYKHTFQAEPVTASVVSAKKGERREEFKEGRTDSRSTEYYKLYPPSLTAMLMQERTGDKKLRGFFKLRIRKKIP